MYTLDDIRPVWAEVDMDNLIHNVKEIKKRIDPNVLVTAVVKGNGYGHGAIEISKILLDNGADRLAVAIIAEGMELRHENITSPILILGYTPPIHFKELLEYDLIQTIYNYEDALALSKKAVEIGKIGVIHIKIDTGMSRLGFLPTEEIIHDIINISKLPNIYIEGIYTHFAKADELDKSHTMEQWRKFADIIDKLEQNGLDIPIKHASNSAGIMELKEYGLNMVRAGVMIYGLYPSDEVSKDVVLKPTMKLKAKISNLKTVPKGTGISYGQIYVTDRESKIATIPIGYADGFTRMLTDKAEVIVCGQRAKVVGKICMDQCMIDVTHIENVKRGDMVTIFGGEPGEISVEELAEILGTVNYEVICMVGRRVPRVYISKGNIIAIKDYLLG